LQKNPNFILAASEYADKGSGDVARSFDLSYAQLSDDSKTLLKRLALGPVPAASIEAAAALADLPVDVVTGSLRELAQESLIDEDETRGSYQIHDLIRRYGRSLAANDNPAENRTAVNRLLSYYRAAAAKADIIFTRQLPPEAIDPPASSVEHHFVDRPSTIEWIRAELPNLLACADYVANGAEGNDSREENSWVILFACALAGVLRNEGQWRRSIDLQARAVTAAEKIHVPLAVANALAERGFLYRLTADLDLAVADLERAMSIYRQVGGTDGLMGEAHALNTYGVVLDQLDRPEEAQQRLAEALGIYRRINYPLGEANVLHDQGMAEFFAGNYDAAVRLLGKSLELYQVVGQPLGMAHAHNNLARAQQRTGADGAAAGNLESARLLYRELGNILGEINVVMRLGVVLARHDRDKAVDMLNDAIRKSVDIDNWLAQIDALDALGNVYVDNQDTRAAVDMWSRASRIAREHGVQREEARLTAKIRDVR
jgi:tetratricopeptide (TPR) repeat protein